MEPRFLTVRQDRGNLYCRGVIGLIEGGHIGGRGSGDWKSGFLVRVPRADGGCDNLSATAPEAQAFYRQFFPALAGHLKARGWDKRYRQHLADEPINENAASYRDIAKLVHETAPGIRVIEATQTRALVGAVNTWVPILDHLHRDYDSSASGNRRATKSGSIRAAAQPAATPTALSSNRSSSPACCTGSTSATALPATCTGASIIGSRATRPSTKRRFDGRAATNGSSIPGTANFSVPSGSKPSRRHRRL